jgi:hypothetical protein
MLPKLKKSHFYAQFPNHEQFDGEPDASLPEWWEEEKFKEDHNSHHAAKRNRLVKHALSKVAGKGKTP